MVENLEHILHIVLSVPLLLYLGISIILGKDEPDYFNYLVLIALILIFIIHLRDFYYLYQKIKSGQNFEKLFGVLLVLIAGVILFINIFKMVTK